MGVFVCGRMGRFGLTMKKVSILLVFITAILQGQPDTLWTTTFGDSNSHAGRALDVTSDGGYITTGFSGTPYDLLLVKFDSQGNEEWNNIYSGDGGNSVGNDVQQTTDGGFVITGYYAYMVGASIETDLWLIKTDSQGNEEWEKNYGGDCFDVGGEVQETEDGGYIITGTLRMERENGWCNDADVWLIKTDSNGNIEWENTFDYNLYDDWGRSVKQTADGGYIIVGTKDINIVGIPHDIWLIKTDSQGNEEWNNTFDSGYREYGTDIEIDADGGFIIAGYRIWDEYYYTLDDELFFIKTDSYGDTIWTSTFDIGYYENVLDGVLTNDGSYIITGQTTFMESGTNLIDSEVLLLKINSDGDSLWTKTFGGVESDKGYSVKQTSDNGYIIAGTTASFGNEFLELYLIRTIPDIENATASIQELPSSFYLHNNYPNPFNPVTTLRYDLPKDALVNITIYDMMGRVVKTMVNSQQNAGFKSVRWNATNDKGAPVSAGVYLYTIEAGQFRQTKKMVLLK